MSSVGTEKKCPNDIAAGSLWKVRYHPFLGLGFSRMQAELRQSNDKRSEAQNGVDCRIVYRAR